MKLILTGAQGTGKSTMLQVIANEYPDMLKITEVVRQLNKTGVKINEKGNTTGQNKIFKTYVDTFNDLKCSNYVSDRGLTDVAAYTLYHVSQNSIKSSVYDKEVQAIKEWVKDNPDLIFMYFPIEFDVVDDGVRSMNEEFRRQIDTNIRTILQECNIDYYIIEGTIEEREELIKNIIAFNCV